MQTTPSSAPKPRAEIVRLEITRLPKLTLWRNILRRLIMAAARLLVWLFIRVEAQGQENFPLKGPSLIVANHLGDADVVVGLTIIPKAVDSLAKSELFDYPILGKLMDAYGVVWVHRGQPDRRALRIAKGILQENRILAIAPEGRESLSGSLEEGTRGAAYLALETDAPLLPVTFTGTENDTIYSNLKRLRRSTVSVTIGPVFRLEREGGGRESIDRGTQKIMATLAQQLPENYRGVYQTSQGSINVDK